ncbi:elongation factor 1-alpha C-terminal domain-related protein, partial [Streptomyces vinaceus]
PHVVLAVNKMDLVGYEESVFAKIAEEFTAYATRLGIRDVVAVPISALAGDNVVEPSAHMDWYGGPTLLEHLETVPADGTPADLPFRFPVQYVIRPQSAEHPDYRGYAGQIASGSLRTGDTVTVLPSGHRGTVAGIDALGDVAETASAGRSVTLRLAEDLDVSRGDLIVAGEPPRLTRDVEATVCHLHERPLRPGERVLVKHTTRTVRAVVREVSCRIDIDTLERHPGEEGLFVNDIGRVVLRTAEPLALDDYRDNRSTGSFLLIDPADGSTRAAGMTGSTPLAGGARA